MSHFEEIALPCVKRGWSVIPCLPYGTHRQDCQKSKGGDTCIKRCAKTPLVPGGFYDASDVPEQVKKWAVKWPNAECAIACGKSGKSVLDIDHGLTDLEAAKAWLTRNGLPTDTYMVRTGRRPEFGLQVYFNGTMPDVPLWKLDGCEGQVKSAVGYVMAAGSLHSDTGQPYAPVVEYSSIDALQTNVAPLPDRVRALHTEKEKAATGNAKVPKSKWTLPVTEGQDRTGFLLEQTGQMRNLGCGYDAILAHMIELNEDPEIIADPLPMERVEATAKYCSTRPVPPAPPTVTIGPRFEAQEPVTDWRTRYHTLRR